MSVDPAQPGFGPSGLSRLDRDVLGQDGISAVLMLIGINDLGNSQVPATAVIDGYRKVIAAAHAHGLPIIAGTLTPAGDATAPDPFGYSTAPIETQRHLVNDWIRHSGAFDGVIDFDAAVRDTLDRDHWRPGYSFDNLHGNDAGYRQLADAIPLRMFDSLCQA